LAKKRANGDGNLRKRPNGLWELTTMIGYQPGGREKPQHIRMEFKIPRPKTASSTKSREF